MGCEQRFIVRGLVWIKPPFTLEPLTKPWQIDSPSVAPSAPSIKPSHSCTHEESIMESLLESPLGTTWPAWESLSLSGGHSWAPWPGSSSVSSFLSQNCLHMPTMEDTLGFSSHMPLLWCMFPFCPRCPTPSLKPISFRGGVQMLPSLWNLSWLPKAEEGAFPSGYSQHKPSFLTALGTQIELICAHRLSSSWDWVCLTSSVSASSAGDRTYYKEGVSK